MFDVELFDGANDSWLQRDAKCMATFNGQKGLRMTCNEWLESQRINGGPHGFECIGSERMQQVWNAAQSDCANRLRMTRDELIVIALVAGFPTWWIDPPEPERKGMTLPMLELFAELIGKRATMEVVQCKQ